MASEAKEVDTTDEYDRAHGVTTLADAQRLVNLSEGNNKAPAQYVPFKITQSK